MDAEAVAAIQQLAVDFADKMQELALYLKGLVTSQASNWMERIREWARWILEKMRELYQRLAWSVLLLYYPWSVGCNSSFSSEMRAASASATESVLRAVQKAMLLTVNLIHDEDLYGDDLQHVEKLYDVLEDAEAKLTELQHLGSWSLPQSRSLHGGAIRNEENDLESENRRLKEQRTCKICMDKEIGVVFLPCGHLICCVQCAPALKDCPLCRQPIHGTVKTYMS